MANKEHSRILRPLTRKVNKAIGQLLPDIIAVAEPLRVLLFGSASNGRVGPESDLDFLVIVEDQDHVSSVADRLNIGVRNKPIPCDFVVATPSILRRHIKDRNSVYSHALTHGRELYAVR